MTSRWRFLDAKEDAVEELVRKLSIPEAIARILVIRGMGELSSATRFLQKSMNDLASPFELAGMKEAANRVCRAIQTEEPIVIHGDFDADGITSAAMLTLFLRDVGAKAIPFVPNRLVEGHGISLRAIDLARSNGAHLLITCDCGSSSEKEIVALKQAGIETIVTDHHQVGENFQSSAIVVNPKVDHGESNHDDLSGVGVAFMLAVAVRSELRDLGWFTEKKEPNLKEYLDIVALGTVADMAPLLGQNRILVAKGLEQLVLSTRPGIVAMREVSGLTDSALIHAEDVGFRLAPKINAAARLGHATEALELLMSNDKEKALKLAKQLESWNEERKNLQTQMVRIAAIEAERQVTEEKVSIVVSSEDFHPGIIGLVAQKLSETYRAPAFVFALEGDLARGSARSRWGINLMAAMEACKDLLLGFGGHLEAGGCTMKRSDVGEFKKRFEQAVRAQGVAATREVLIDAELKLRHLNPQFLSSLNQLRPFGMGNPEPVFFAKARVVGSAREMGKDHVRVTLRDDEGPTYSAVGFGMWRSIGGELQGNVEVAYTPDENEWQGRRDLRIRLRHARCV